MNHHARSYSEQPQVAPLTIGNNQHQSFIRVHSDSQQSLDQLFNPPTHQSSVPLRNRNLPQSFFNPGTKPATDSTNGTTNGTHTTNDVHMSNGNSLHMRSISFDQHQPVQSNRLSTNQRMNLHTRTHSTIAPMPRLLSNHSSQEFLNGSPMQQDNSNNASANNVSSPNHNNISLQQSFHQNHHNATQHHSNTNTHHTLHTNGWSSTANSMDDLPSSPQWPAARAVRNTNIPAQANLQQQVQVAAIPQAGLPPEPAPMQQASHQQAFYSAHSIPAAAAVAEVNSVHVATNNFHARSLSFNQRPETQMINHGFHMRTHSTIAPMSGPCNLHPAAATVASHQSSHQSSQDFLNHSSATNGSGSTGWSSSGYSTDDMTTNGHCWNGGAQSQVPLGAGPPMATAQGQTTLHHQHHHNHLQQQQHVQPVVTQAQDPQSQQVYYQV